MLQPEDYQTKLNQKLSEELKEYYESNNIEELADLVEVVYAILDFKEISIADFEDLRLRKKHLKGGFEKRLFLKTMYQKQS